MTPLPRVESLRGTRPGPGITATEEFLPRSRVLSVDSAPWINRNGSLRGATTA